MRERSLVMGWLTSLILASAALLAVPFGVRQVIDRGFSDPSKMSEAFVSLGAIALLLAGTTSARLFFVSHLGDRVAGHLRRDLFRWLLERNLDFHHGQSSTDLLSRLTTDAEFVRILAGTALSTALRSVITLVGALTLLFLTIPTLAALSLVVIPLAVAPIVIASRRLRLLSRSALDHQAHATSMAAEALAAIRTVKEFGRQRFEAERYARALDETHADEHRRVAAQALLAATAIALVFSAVIGLLWIGARMVTAGDVSAGTLGQFLLFAVIGGMATTELLEIWSAIQRAAGAVSRIAALDFLAATDEASEGAHKPVSARLVEFEGVGFCYRNAEASALEDITFCVEQGRHLAIVGPSGGGKSSVLALLARLYEPQRGRILLDGVDLRAIPEDGLRKLVAVVPQSPAIFARSVRDNIRYGCLNASDAEVEVAAEIADADKFVRNLPRGFDESLGERGARLSGGEQQRIAIARAVLADAPILLLDEATSALDAASERTVLRNLRKLGAAKSIISVSHRIASLVDADEILVISSGKIAERGTHDRLISLGGIYASLAEMQRLVEQNTVPQQPFR